MKLWYKITLVFLIAGIILLLLIFLLKAEWLTIDIGPNLPAGTLISWLLVAAYAAAALLLFNRKTGDRVKHFLALTLKINLALAAVWGIVSFLLSGNWAFNFNSEIWFTIWICYTVFVVTIPLIVMACWFAIQMIRRIIKRK